MDDETEWQERVRMAGHGGSRAGSAQRAEAMSFDREAYRRRILASGMPWLQVDLGDQRLWLRRGERTEAEFAVSTAVNGPGERNGSNCTPRGWHTVRAKIGAGAAAGAVFVGRRPTGEIYDAALGQQYPQRDWILTRILWLSGLEPGVNRLGQYDTMRRFIYIHGCPDTEKMGVPGSAGCIRMRNAELIELFDRVPVRTAILIHE